MRLAPSAVFSLLVFLGLVVPWIVSAIGNATVLGSCDPKLGCSGGVTFAILLSVVAGIIAALAAVLAIGPFRAVLAETPRKVFAMAGLASGLSLSVALATVGSWPSINGPLEISALVLEWLLFCLVVCSAWLFFARVLGRARFMRGGGE